MPSSVEYNGKTYKFLDNVGYGIDGYCCEEADRIKAKSPNKKINYKFTKKVAIVFGFIIMFLMKLNITIKK